MIKSEITLNNDMMRAKRLLGDLNALIDWYNTCINIYEDQKDKSDNSLMKYSIINDQFGKHGEKWFAAAFNDRIIKYVMEGEEKTEKDEDDEW